MRVLVACEFSGVVRDEFVKRGHEAWSCDLLPSDKPGNHHQCDILGVIPFEVHEDYSGWYYESGRDLIIFHPPCKYICNGGNNWLNRRPDLKWRENRELSAEFFMLHLKFACLKIAVENPIGCMSSKFRKPDQIIRPFMFGHEYNKDVCLWLKGLPKLVPTKIIPPPYKHLDVWSTERHKDGRDVKAITFHGIASAMAEQWG